LITGHYAIIFASQLPLPLKLTAIIFIGIHAAISSLPFIDISMILSLDAID
jgi:hypothetical protein